ALTRSCVTSPPITVQSSSWTKFSLASAPLKPVVGDLKTPTGHPICLPLEKSSVGDYRSLLSLGRPRLWISLHHWARSTRPARCRGTRSPWQQATRPCPTPPTTLMQPSLSARRSCKTWSREPWTPKVLIIRFNRPALCSRLPSVPPNQASRTTRTPRPKKPSATARSFTPCSTPESTWRRQYTKPGSSQPPTMMQPLSPSLTACHQMPDHQQRPQHNCLHVTRHA